MIDMKNMIRIAILVLGISVFSFLAVKGSIFLSQQANSLVTLPASIEKEVAENERYAQIELEISGVKPSSAIKVLVNGYVVGNMDQKKKQFSVTDSSLIEIDGSSIKNAFFVKVIIKVIM